ncbi:MAG TPA: glycosyltransferase [Candidatus Solibacter sp.]|nr:glycosyltransferase [Candidatus Solibacter sp.]
MPSGRRFKKKTFLCGHYEAQDVLQEVDDLDLVCLDAGAHYEFREQWQRRLLFHDFSGRLIYQNPGLRKVRLTQEYDLFLARCQYNHDFVHINAIEGWKDHCKISVCWIDEFWAAEIVQYESLIHALRKFDHVFVAFQGTVERLSKAIGKPCRWLSGAVDTLRFSPYPNPPARVIDVYSIGRRYEGIHKELSRAAGGGSLFYLHDTFGGSLSDVHNHREHRTLFANVAKRSKYFLVAPGKQNVPSETGGQEEIGHRYYEGAAAGACLIGQAPKSPSFATMFTWPDAVIETQTDGSDVMEVISRLEADPERLQAISQRNVGEALLRHDWVYRWKEILQVAGLEPLPEMTARERRLRELADSVLAITPCT